MSVLSAAQPCPALFSVTVSRFSILIFHTVFFSVTVGESIILSFFITVKQKETTTTTTTKKKKRKKKKKERKSIWSVFSVAVTSWIYSFLSVAVSKFIILSFLRHSQQIQYTAFSPSPSASSIHYLFCQSASLIYCLFSATDRTDSILNLLRATKKRQYIELAVCGGEESKYNILSFLSVSKFNILCLLRQSQQVQYSVYSPSQSASSIYCLFSVTVSKVSTLSIFSHSQLVQYTVWSQSRSASSIYCLFCQSASSIYCLFRQSASSVYSLFFVTVSQFNVLSIPSHSQQVQCTIYSQPQSASSIKYTVFAERFCATC